MKKKKILFSCLLTLMSVGMAQAQTAYTYVQQNGTYVGNDGIATFDISSQDATMEFDSEGNGIMTIGDVTVAKLPIDANGGELCADFSSSTGAGSVSAAAVNSVYPYATIYSPFQLVVPAQSTGVEVYAPSYDEETHMLKFNSSTRLADGTIVPVGTALLVKNVSDGDDEIVPVFSFPAPTAAATVETVLGGSALTIPVTDVQESGKTIYTYGQKKNGTDYGFYAYVGTNLNPGRAYLNVATVDASGSKSYIGFDTDEVSTGINTVESNVVANGTKKYIDNGRVVILKNGQKYNLNGQEVK